MDLDCHALGQLTDREWRWRMLVNQHGRAGAARIAAQQRVRYQRQLVLDATEAVLRHQRRGNEDREWAERCRRTLAVTRRQYLEARERLAEIDGRQQAAK